MWQDIVIATCQIFFVVALMPSVFSDDKPALSTAIMHTILITIITFALFSLELWFTASTAAAVGVVWVILAVQKFKLDRQKVIK